ncbi:MAG: HAMP domain-containing histidine kinase [Clostridiales bacterium]|nr:HAMP domain-containing histidine kinase [Clostridiales bacterium]
MRKVLSSLSFLAVHALTLFITFKVISRFVEVQGAFMFVLTGEAAIVVMFVVFAALMNLLSFSSRHQIRDMHRNLTYALNEIANGNFNVFVEIDPHAPHKEIAEAMNEMARKLGTLESMRQDFISNVSHEIQSPLTSIVGFAKLMKDNVLPEERRRHYAEIIETESKRLSSLSDNLLKLSALDNNKIPLARTDFRLDKQLEQVALTLEPQWGAKNIEMSAELSRTIVSADADLLSQVWINLLSNAIKFTPEGGAIMVTLKDRAVTIEDTGSGISSDDKPHVFERFYKVDKARDRSLGGNGLGLSIVKKILELHGFSIALESELGKGTKFTIGLS